MPHEPFEPAELSARVGFSHNRLKRHSERRDDEPEIARWRAQTDAAAVVLAGERPILRKNGQGFTARFPLAFIDSLGEARETPFLGTLDDMPIFAVLLDEAAAEPIRE